MKVIAIFDDTGRKCEAITDIIGNKGLAEVVVKRKHLEDYYKEALLKIYKDFQWRKVHSFFEFSDIAKNMEAFVGSDTKILHCFSNYLISDIENATLSFQKLRFVSESMAFMMSNRVVAVMFPNAESYISFCKNITLGQKPWDIARSFQCNTEIEGLVDIGNIANFIQCITGNFDARYFNSLKGNEYTLVKSSSNKKKIKAEYSFYHLLPEDMKYWFVMPFNYTENENSSSYTMERLHMTDLAIKWVHGSMDELEFSELMDKYFYFFKCRHVKSCTKEEYQKIADNLYIAKVNERIADLKTLPAFKKIENLLSSTNDTQIDILVNKYFSLKDKIESKNKYKFELAIGHGDPCFANTLYNKSTKTLKFIDPKGAITEPELWTNPYYDIAKLSHSVCGRYDFFNNALFDIKIDSSFSYDLEIPFDNLKYVEIFKNKVIENGFDYSSVRLYEASLFLSMLPLHIDNPHKVFGFILNVKNILKDIEKNV